jgi:hypothetical protein
VYNGSVIGKLHADRIAYALFEHRVLRSSIPVHEPVAAFPKHNLEKAGRAPDNIQQNSLT